MSNKFTDLNNHLFAQLERLSKDDLTEEDLHKEVERAKAINGVSQQIINMATLVLEAHKEVDMRDQKSGLCKLIGNYMDDFNNG